MTETVSVVVGDYPHTKSLKSHDSLAGTSVRFPHVSPVHDAFDDMIRDRRYDVCELAIAAFLQARQAGKPLVLLPAVMVGGFHHGSIYASPEFAGRSPRDLKGTRVGVRAYSQTTGLWVRAWLREEYGVSSDSVTWVTTEGSHAEEYHDPENVTRSDTSLVDALRTNDIAAAILGRAAAPPDPHPLLTDADEHDHQWYARHATVPVNHLVVTTTDFAARHTAVLEEIYQQLCTGIDRTVPAGAPGALPSAIRYGRDALRDVVALAAAEALEQRLISEPIGDIDALFAL